MLAARGARAGIVKFALLCVAAEIFAAAGICGWLTDARISGQLWPADINAVVVSFFGGSVENDVLGVPQAALGVFAVWVRLFCITAVFCGLSVFRQQRGKSEKWYSSTTEALWHTVLVSAACGVWWLLTFVGAAVSPLLTRICVTLLPQAAMLLVALFCWIWWQAIVPAARPSETESPDAKPVRRSSGPVLFLTGCVLGWVAVSFWLNYCLYQQVLIPHGDSAMYEEHLWNVWHAKGFRSYLDQGLFLGEHIQVIHLLLLPLHMLWPSHLLLELAESVALGSCAVPIYLIAKRHTQHSWAAAILGVAWLFYFPMHFLDIAIDQKTFRPIALGLPFLFWMIHFAEVRRFGRAFVCLLLVLSAKEDMALLAGPLLFVMAFAAGTRDAGTGEFDADADADAVAQSRQARHCLLGLSAFCVFYLVVVVLVIIPAFRDGDHVHYSRYFGELGGTPSELVKTAVTDPLKVVRQAVSVQTFWYVCVFLGPFAFLPLRRPLLLMAGTLTFGMLSLLQFEGPEAGGLPPVPFHHFHAPLLAVVFWAGVLVIGRLPDVHRWAMLVLCCSVATSATGSMMPCGVGFWSEISPFGYSRLYASSDLQQQERAEMIDRVVDAIPLTARVASTDYVHTRLTHCERSYDYSGYLRKVNDYKPGVPADTDYIVIDTAHRYSDVKSAADVRELLQEPDQWELLPDTTGGVYLILKRR